MKIKTETILAGFAVIALGTLGYVYVVQPMLSSGSATDATTTPTPGAGHNLSSDALNAVVSKLGDLTPTPNSSGYNQFQNQDLPANWSYDTPADTKANPNDISGFTS